MEGTQSGEHTASPYPLTSTYYHPSQTASQPMLTHKQSQNPEQPSPTSQANVTSSPPSDAGGKYCTMKGLINNIDTTDWYELGVQLTTNVAGLDIIRHDYRNDARGALIEMFILVLRDNPELTWPTVVEAFETINDKNRANKIRDKFCIVRSGGLNTLGNTRGTTISGDEERRLCESIYIYLVH